MSDNEVPTTSKGIQKNPSGKLVTSGQKIMAYNIYLNHKNKGSTKTRAVTLAATEVGISQRLMFNIVAEMENTGKLTSPSKKRMRKDFYTKLSEDEKKAVRHTVHSFLKRNEMPTLDKVLQAIKENELISPMSRSTLFKVLKKLGFVWKKRVFRPFKQKLNAFYTEIMNYINVSAGKDVKMLLECAQQFIEHEGFIDQLAKETPFTEDALHLLDAFLKRLRGPVCFVAHNGEKFIYSLLRNYIKTFNYSFPTDYVCVDAIRGFQTGGGPKISLKNLYEGTTGKQAKVHVSAKMDVELLLECACKEARTFIAWANSSKTPFII